MTFSRRSGQPTTGSSHKFTPGWEVIRKNPSRTSDLLLHIGGR